MGERPLPLRVRLPLTWGAGEFSLSRRCRRAGRARWPGWCSRSRSPRRLALSDAAKVTESAVSEVAPGGSDAAWHSVQARTRHTGSSAYVWLDYVMIRSMSRRWRFR